MADRELDAEVIAALGRRTAAPQQIDPTKVYAVPIVRADGGEEIVALELEPFLPAPRRAKGLFKHYTVASFVEFYLFHAHEPGAAVFVDRAQPQIRGVFNGHASQGLPGWHDFAADLVLRPTPEWQTWIGSNNKPMSQAVFSEFLEDNLPDISRPPGARMLEVVKTFEANKGARFMSSVRLDNGDVQLNYEETTQAKAGVRGKLEVPLSFSIHIPVWEGCDPRTVEARLRYRIEDGALRLSYSLLRPHKTVEATMDNIVDAIVKGIKVTKTPLYLGTPAGPQK